MTKKYDTRALGNNFTQITTKNFVIQIKHFPRKSQYGIRKGRISKLWLANRRTIAQGRTILASYDRGWDRRLRKSAPKEARLLYQYALRNFN